MQQHFSNFPYHRIRKQDVQEEATRTLTQLQQSHSAEQQWSILREWDQIAMQWEENFQLAFVRFTQDTTSESAQKEREYCDQIRPFVQGQEQRIIQHLLQSPYRSSLEKKLGHNLLLSWDLDLQAFSPKIDLEKQEESSLTAQYSTLLAQISVPFRGQEYTLSGLAPFFQSSDRQTRLAARQAQDQAFVQRKDKLDDIFDRLVQLRHRMAQKMGFSSYTRLGYAEMRRTDYSAVEVEIFRQQVLEEIVPIAQRILRTRAKRLNVSDYSFHDEGLLDQGGSIPPKGDHDWMLERAQSMFSQMGTDFGQFFTMMRQRGLMDLKMRAGKTGGGYCTMFGTQEAPFIFANFNGTENDVRVFTHECGHAFQVFNSRSQPLRSLMWPTAEAAEIHSMSLEFLTYPWMKDFFLDDDERFQQHHLESALLFIPYGTAVDEFQHLVYANPAATPDDRADMWKLVERKYLPLRTYPTLPHFSSGRFWQRQGHIYLRPFYYIDYCLAQVCALQFWTLSKENSDLALERYRSLCALGGSLSFTDLLETVNLQSPFQPGTIRHVIQAPLRALRLPS